LNNDGNLDIITGNSPGYDSGWGDRASISVLYGNGTGAFPSFETFPSLTMSGGPTSLAVGDFNGDGRIDVAAAGPHEVDVVYNSDNWSSLDNRTYTLPYPWTDATYTAAVAVGDVNGDGRPDLVAADNSGAVYILLNNGATLGFAAPQPYDAGGSAA